MRKTRIFWLLSLFMILAVLTACKDDNNKYDINISSNLDSVTIESRSELSDKGETSYTVTAPDVDGWTFLYWTDISDPTAIIKIATTQSYTFITSDNIDLKAVYQDSSILHTVSISSSVTGANPVLDRAGNVVFIEASGVSGYTFLHWLDSDTSEIISTELIYSFTADKAMSLEAVYQVITVLEFTITLSSDIETASLTLERTVNSITITATELVGYTFIKWIDADTDTTVSTNLSYTFQASTDQNIEAVYEEIIVVIYTITLTSDVVDATLTQSQTDNSVTITATELVGYTFIKWIDSTSEVTISFDLSYTFTATSDQTLEAVYSEITGEVPTLIYGTEFEDASKASYGIGTVSLSSSIWTFSDALIGNLSGDLDVSGMSVRIRDGYIDTEFSIEDISQVIFYAGTYGSDTNTIVNFQISLDGIVWVTVDSFTTTNSMDEHSYVFNEELFTSLSLDSTEDFFFRIESETEARTNIDNFQVYSGEGTITNDDPLYTIEFTEDMVFQYILGETVDLTSCEATHTTTGVTTCDIIGTVDSSIAGIYDVIFYKTDEFDNTATLTVRISVIDPDADYLSLDLSTYYDDAEGLFGDSLIDALRTIINTGFVGVDYGAARYILDDTDEDPNNPNNLILIYFGTSIPESWDGGSTWNREHVWPQSLLGSSADNNTVNSASDLFNLMPANPGENSSRSNDPYTAILNGYEPRDEVKGDVARALFYMVIMYEELNLVNTAPSLYEMGYLDELLAWHFADPVDAFELNRLEVIFGEQLNRNPFVDYPHFVELIWFTE